MGNSDSHPTPQSLPHDPSDPQIGYRVVSVDKGSPAEKAGIEAQIDFIKYNPYKDSNGRNLSDIFLENEGKEITLQVYNLIQ